MFDSITETRFTAQTGILIGRTDGYGWQHLQREDGKFRQVGPWYVSKAEILADHERYLTEAGWLPRATSDDMSPSQREGLALAAALLSQMKDKLAPDDLAQADLDASIALCKSLRGHATAGSERAHVVCLCPDCAEAGRRSMESAAELGRLREANARLTTELRALIRGYVSLMEIGRDRIVSLGGTCDPVGTMEAADPRLRSAQDVLAQVGGGHV